MKHDQLADAAFILGKSHGHQRAIWVINAGVNDIAAKAIVEGYEASDPDIMELCPNPLSGEWADDPAPMHLLDEIANLAKKRGKLDIDSGEDVLDMYEKTFSASFWDVTLKYAKGTLK